MNPRTISFLLLLTSTVMAGPPKHPDPPAGRQAFNQCMVHAETAWKNGRTEEALRWYHTAKNVARAHDLTLTERDEALTAYVARHEAGLTGPQPGTKPGCDTDGIAPTDSKSKSKTARRLPPITTKSRSLATKTIPVPVKKTLSTIETTRRSIPENRPARSLTPPETPKATPTTKRPATIPTPKLPPAPKKQPEKNTTATATVDSDLVPPITSPEQPTADTAVEDTPVKDTPVKDTPVKDTPVEIPPATDTPAAEETPAVDASEKETPAAGTSTPDVTTNDDPGSAAALPPVAKTSATAEAQITEQPVRLTVDQSVVPLKIIPNDHKSEMAARPISPDSLTEAATESLPIPGSPAADHQLILLMFGPIVVALFILGLLTHEMPGPKRILAWATRRNSDPVSAVDDDAPLVSKTVSEGLESTRDMLTVTLGTRRRNKVEYYTATIELPGLEPTRLVKRRGGSALFRSRAAAISSARALARRIGYDGITEPASRRKAA